MDFISYSKHDARAFAKNLRHDLKARSFTTWMDESDIPLGRDWRLVIKTAINECERFLFIISHESVKSSECKRELKEAQRNGKAIIPIRFHPVAEAELPEQIRRLQYLDFVSNERALAQLFVELGGGTEPSKEPTDEPLAINSPPLVIPSHFRGRKDEIRSITDFLCDDAKPLLLIAGREGSGKTALICHVLDMVKRRARHGPQMTARVDAIIYVNSANYCRVSWPRLFGDLSQLLSSQKKRAVERLFTQPGITVTFKMQGLLSALADRRILVLLDHFEDVIDATTAETLDSELAEALQSVLERNSPMVKLIITSQVTPKDLFFSLPAGPSFIDLGHGLPLREAKEVLYALDNNGQLGLASASQELLDEIIHGAQGNPWTLERLCAHLRIDRDTPALEFLRDLVGRTFQRLDPPSQKIMQALAIYARPVTVEAVNYLLQPYLPNANAQSLLLRLVNMRLAQKEADRYSLGKADREYALSTIPEVAFTRLALSHRGADYFRQIALATDEPKTIEDLTPRLAEFDLRYQAQEYEPAARILAEIEETLLAWGHYRQVEEFHGRLRGKLDDLLLSRHQFDALGRVNHRLGNLTKAIHCYEEGLRYVRRMQDAQGECLYLSNLAICFMESGQWDLAITYCRLTLDLAVKLQDRPRQAHVFNTLSDCLAYVGKTAEAISCCERSLTLARDCVRREQEVVALANMGQHYGELGETDKALGKCDKSLTIAKTIKFQLGEAIALRNLADLDVDRNRLKRALGQYKRAIELAEVAQSAQLQQTTRTGLALALLFSGELANARTWVETACQYDVRALNCEAFAVLGVIAQRQGDSRAARDAFDKAVQHADAMLKTPQAYKALDAKGLALSGLALSEESTEYIEDSVDAYQAARRITHDTGIVRRVLRCFDELAQVDLAHRLAPVRQAAAGSE